MVDLSLFLLNYDKGTAKDESKKELVNKDDLKIIDKKDPVHRDVPGKGDP